MAVSQSKNTQLVDKFFTITLVHQLSHSLLSISQPVIQTFLLRDYHHTSPSAESLIAQHKSASHSNIPAQGKNTY